MFEVDKGLDGAIAHARKVAMESPGTDCAHEHTQLAEWLEELKFQRSRVMEASEDMGRRFKADREPVSHAVILPFPVSNLVTWCGLKLEDCGGRDLIAVEPSQIDCPRCKESMKAIHSVLSTWVSGLENA